MACPMLVGHVDARLRRVSRRRVGFGVISDVRLFEKLCLEGFQSGLSWLTILRKRETSGRLRRLRPARSRRSAIATSTACSATPASCATAARSSRRSTTPKRALELIDEHGSLAAYFWGFAPRSRRRRARVEIPPRRPAVDGAVEGPQAAWLVVRRTDHGLRLHAGDGARQRPSRRLLRARAGRDVSTRGGAVGRARGMTRGLTIGACRSRPGRGRRAANRSSPPEVRRRRAWRLRPPSNTSSTRRRPRRRMPDVDEHLVDDHQHARRTTRRPRPRTTTTTHDHAPAAPTTTSCEQVVHIGDSTSLSLFDPKGVGGDALTMDQRYRDVVSTVYPGQRRRPRRSSSTSMPTPVRSRSPRCARQRLPRLLGADDRHERRRQHRRRLQLSAPIPASDA